MSEKKSSAHSLLLPYQAEALKEIESHKFSCLMWARQTGKSFLIALFAVLRAVENSNHLVAVISPTERQSKEFMEKVKRHVEFLKIVGAQFGEEFFKEASINVLEVRFPNGSRIMGLPANPDGVRGLTGDVVLEEAAFFRDGYRVYQAIFPSITRSRDYKLIAISTPRTKNDVFAHIWQMSDGNQLWYRQKLTIFDAVSRGLDVDVESIKKAIPSEDIWMQEYLCEFMDENYILLPYEVIHACVLDGVLVGNLAEVQGDIYVGVDIARRGNLTIIAVLEKAGSILYLRKLEIMKNIPFREQFEAIDYYTAFARRVAVDETGIGMQIAEELQRKWGEIKVQRVYFTAKAKEELASRMQAYFQDRRIFIPQNRDLIEDLHSVERTITQSGNIRIEGSSEDSHADRFWAVALALSVVESKSSYHGPYIFSGINWESRYGVMAMV
ncbi:terminase large subunit domain-containing protein [Thermodesulfovibrio thiophilus]|uniref:terminase large subunit domain-containing protein n=1 Tax=Thermodesulfovibrio thiophilus TaxID=340095 RepID=UPI00041930C4|nr:terminase family protein [Thermodesulfovibrio thiophilus]